MRHPFGRRTPHLLDLGRVVAGQLELFRVVQFVEDA